MPEMNGFEVLTMMQMNDRLKNIPVVVMSANESKDIIAECLKLGAKDYLVKPVRMTTCKSLTKFMKGD
jgi:CheY-like chemotaxis protein